MTNLILPDNQKPELTPEQEHEAQIKALAKKKTEKMEAIFQQECGKLRHVWPELFELIVKTNRADILYKNLELMYILDKKKPKSIIEFGSGYTTCVFARYAKATGARFISIEESEAYKQETERQLKSLGLDANIMICPVVKDSKECSYSIIPVKEYDFAYVDGPANNGTADSEGLIRANGRMLADSKVKDIVYDMGAPSVRNFLETVKGYEVLLGHPFLCDTLNYHTIFTKTNYWWE